MATGLGFTVSEIACASEPVVPDPFIAALEPERDDRVEASAGQDEPGCRGGEPGRRVDP